MEHSRVYYCILEWYRIECSRMCQSVLVLSIDNSILSKAYLSNPNIM